MMTGTRESANAQKKSPGGRAGGCRAGAWELGPGGTADHCNVAASGYNHTFGWRPYPKSYMPQTIMATTAITKPADSQHMKDRSRSDMARGYASAAALQLGREIDPRYLRPEAATVLQAGAYCPYRSKAGMRRPRQSVRQFPNRRHP